MSHSRQTCQQVPLPTYLHLCDMLPKAYHGSVNRVLVLMHRRWLLGEHFGLWREEAETQKLQGLTLSALEDLAEWHRGKRKREMCLDVVRHWRYVALTMKHLFTILPKVRAQRLLNFCFNSIAASQFRASKSLFMKVFRAWKGYSIYAMRLRKREHEFSSERCECLLLVVLTEWYRFSAAICGKWLAGWGRLVAACISFARCAPSQLKF